MNRKGFAPILIIGIIALVIIAGVAGWYFIVHQNSAAPAGVACTQDAKQCPDGSWVGRTGPNCEFAACSAVGSSTVPAITSTSAVTTPAATTSLTASTLGWKTYTNNTYGYELKYPNNWFIDTTESNSAMTTQTAGPDLPGGSTAWSNYPYPQDQYDQIGYPADDYEIDLNIYNASDTTIDWSLPASTSTACLDISSGHWTALSGQVGDEYTTTDKCGGEVPATTAYIIYENKVFDFVSNVKTKNILDGMLSTFSVLK